MNILRATKWRRRNTDKPHRCPTCHAVSNTAYNARDNQFIWYMTCQNDGTRWLYLRRY